SNVYSLVPYQGKHGSNRRPIYIECRGDGLCFYPDRQTLSGPQSPDRLRQEIVRRGALLVRPALPGFDEPPRPKTAPKAEGPYVLCLVRPDGISAYENLWNALQGYEIDFGYEFVDADWVLDFSG